METFFDTSVLVAAFWSGHPQHLRCLTLFSQATPSTSSCALHSLAELYATMTALPVRAKYEPEQVVLFVDEVRRRLSMIALDETDYAATIEDISRRRIVSGQVYDALLIRCAEKSNASIIYTGNARHFRSTAPHLADRIRTP